MGPYRRLWRRAPYRTRTRQVRSRSSAVGGLGHTDRSGVLAVFLGRVLRSPEPSWPSPNWLQPPTPRLTPRFTTQGDRHGRFELARITRSGKHPTEAVTALMSYGP